MTGTETLCNSLVHHRTWIQLSPQLTWCAPSLLEVDVSEVQHPGHHPEQIQFLRVVQADLLHCHTHAVEVTLVIQQWVLQRARLHVLKNRTEVRQFVLMERPSLSQIYLCSFSAQPTHSPSTLQTHQVIFTSFSHLVQTTHSALLLFCQLYLSFISSPSTSPKALTAVPVSLIHLSIQTICLQSVSGILLPVSLFSYCVVLLLCWNVLHYVTCAALSNQHFINLSLKKSDWP